MIDDVISECWLVKIDSVWNIEHPDGILVDVSVSILGTVDKIRF